MIRKLCVSQEGQAVKIRVVNLTKVFFCLLLFLGFGSIAFGGEAELKEASCRGDLATVKSELENGTSPTPDALVCATMGGFRDILKELFDFGANPDQKDSLGRTALVEAISKGNAEVYSLLLDRRANPNVEAKSGCAVNTFSTGLSLVHPRKSGCTALMAAIEKKNVTLIERLLKLRADVAKELSPNQNAYSAFEYGLLQDLPQGALIKLYRLATPDAAISFTFGGDRNFIEATRLDLALFLDRTDLLSFLISKGELVTSIGTIAAFDQPANVFQSIIQLLKDPAKNAGSVIQAAIDRKSPSVFRMLVEAGLNENQMKKKYRWHEIRWSGWSGHPGSFLMSAIKARQLEMVKLILSNGRLEIAYGTPNYCSVDCQSEELTYAAQNDPAFLAEMLPFIPKGDREEGMIRQALARAPYEAYSSMMLKALLNRGSDLNWLHGRVEQISLLVRAAELKDIQLVDQLISKGANPDFALRWICPAFECDPEQAQYVANVLIAKGGKIETFSSTSKRRIDGVMAKGLYSAIIRCSSEGVKTALSQLKGKGLNLTKAFYPINEEAQPYGFGRYHYSERSQRGVTYRFDPGYAPLELAYEYARVCPRDTILDIVTAIFSASSTYDWDFLKFDKDYRDRTTESNWLFRVPPLNQLGPSDPTK